MKNIFIGDFNSFGMSDIDSGLICISNKLSFANFIDTIIHEATHIITRTIAHNNNWVDVYHKLGGKKKKFVDFSIGGVTYNIGLMTGVDQLLTDYSLLQQYKRTSQHILGDLGGFDLEYEDDGTPMIRLYPTPKGTFPVAVQYIPVINEFKTPTARMLAYDALLAETKIMVGSVRRKISGVPTPNGNSLSLDGDELVKEGKEERDALIERAVQLGEPLGIYKW